QLSPQGLRIVQQTPQKSPINIPKDQQTLQTLQARLLKHPLRMKRSETKRALIGCYIGFIISSRTAQYRSDQIYMILSPIQDFLHVYEHTLNLDQRESIRRALNGVELLLVRVDPHPTDPDALAQQESIQRYVREAANGT